MKTFKTMQRQTLNLPPVKDQLNPKLFMEDRPLLHPEVHNALVDASDDFVERLGINSKFIDDVRIVGSNAGYNYNDGSDVDATIMLSRDMDLTKEEVRRLQISANNLTYKYHPTLNGIDLNFYISTRNVGGLRPSRQSIYSLEKIGHIAGPTKSPELAPNFLAGKANYFLELIEECVGDDDMDADECSNKLLQQLKKFRARGLASREGEESAENLIWRMLSHSGYIKVLKQKVDELEKNYFQIQTPQAIIRNEEFRLLIKEGAGVDTIPHSIVKWNKRILLGQDPRDMITRIRPILALFLCMEHSEPLTDHSCA